MKKLLAILMAAALLLTLSACQSEDEKTEESTLSAMVVSVDGTVLTVIEMDADSMGGSFAGGERPEMPEGMENFQGFDPESFDPEAFGGSFSAGGSFPQWGEGEMPEGMTPPENGEMPEFDFESGEMPEFDFENGEMPSFGGGMGRDFSALAEDAETTQIDIADAHISIEIDGGKASGSLSDIQEGSFVTVTVNADGKVTYVLVSSASGRGGRGQTG